MRGGGGGVEKLKGPDKKIDQAENRIIKDRKTNITATNFV